MKRKRKKVCPKCKGTGIGVKPNPYVCGECGGAGVPYPTGHAPARSAAEGR